MARRFVVAPPFCPPGDMGSPLSPPGMPRLPTGMPRLPVPRGGFFPQAAAPPQSGAVPAAGPPGVWPPGVVPAPAAGGWVAAEWPADGGWMAAEWPAAAGGGAGWVLSGLLAALAPEQGGWSGAVAGWPGVDMSPAAPVPGDGWAGV